MKSLSIEICLSSFCAEVNQSTLVDMLINVATFGRRSLYLVRTVKIDGGERMINPVKFIKLAKIVVNDFFHGHCRVENNAVWCYTHPISSHGRNRQNRVM